LPITTRLCPPDAATLANEWRIGLKRGARSSNGHVAVIENPSHHGLIDIDALDLVHVYLNSVALNEAVRVDNAAVRNHNLVHPADEPRAQTQAVLLRENRLLMPPIPRRVLNGEKQRLEVQNPTHAALVSNGLSRL
jgi:hypothetical protein